MRSNGERLIGALWCKHPQTVTVLTESGAQHQFSTEKTPIEDRKSTGRSMTPIDKKDTAVAMITRS